MSDKPAARGTTTITKRPETRELIVERVLGAPRERVWLSWTRPEHVARWWGPRAWTATIHEMDVRPNGVWRYTLAPDDGDGEPARCRATYRDVEEPHRLSFLDTFADASWQSIEGTDMDTLVTFESVGRATLLTITTRFASVDDLTNAEEIGMVQGLSDALDRLDAYVTEPDTATDDTHTQETAMHTVTSADGTTIAYEKTGQGPALILVATTAADHHDLDGIAELLAAQFTVYNYDRRGRGDSGDPQPYDPRREIEDVDALINAAGGSAALAGGSGGCVLALDAATALGPKVSALYLYEPPFIVDDGRAPVPADYVERVTDLVAAGRRSDAMEVFFVEAVGVPAEFVETMKADPSWEAMTRYAHTLAYDGRIVRGTQDGRPLPADRWDVSVPASVVVGSQSESFFHTGAQALVDLLPNATYRQLDGQDHSAFWMAPQEVTDDIVRELTGGAR